MGIPNGIKKEHVIRALAALDAGESHDFGQSTGYDLIHDGKTYPPKAAVGIAARFATGQALHPQDFSGGEGVGQANHLLRQLGFNVVSKTTGTAFILTWNADKWTWDNYDQHVTGTLNGNPVDEPWTTHNKGISTGDRLFLLRQGKVRGLIGAGRAASDCYFTESELNWLETKRTWHVLARFDTLLHDEEVLPTDSLVEHVSAIDWQHIFASGRIVPAHCMESLERVWKAHLEKIGRLECRSPDEVSEALHYREGATRQITVNAYERNPQARKACIAYYGAVCVVCGFNFGAFYGELGEGFTHVHHCRDLATIGEEYEVDPIQDLRPVCPNCHAMLHRKVPAMSIEELRGVLRR